MTGLKEKCLAGFSRRFGGRAEFFIQAPGRVNLIGEHTDYNSGFALPMAIHRSIGMAIRLTGQETVRVYSLDYGEERVFELHGLQKGPFAWIEYLKGVAWALQAAGYPSSGFEAVLAGDIPIGAGLSSSAALETASAMAFSAAAPFQWEASVMAKLCQRAENEWVGMECGLMDQLICAAGREGHVLFLDCRSLAMQFVPLPEDILVMIMDTTTKRDLVHSAYRERREQCRTAAQILQVASLRDLDAGDFERRSKILDALLRKRVKHVLTENARVLEAVQAMREDRVDALGRLMNESHRSLRDDFEVSGHVLDTIVERAQSIHGCLGARMTGAGFSGCAVALVRRGYEKEFAASLIEAFSNSSGLTPGVYACRPQSGAAIQSLG